MKRVVFLACLLLGLVVSDTASQVRLRFVIPSVAPQPPVCDVFVATTGDNMDPGSEAQPWATIGFGTSQLVAGDTLCVRTGTYSGSANTINTALATVPSGTAGNPITIRAYPGEVVTIEQPDGLSAIRLKDGGRHYLIIQDVIVDGTTNTTQAADMIALDYGSSNNLFLDLEVRDGYGNCYVFARVSGDTQDNEIRGGSIHHCGQAAGVNSGYGVYGSTPTMTIDGVEIYENGGYGLHLTDNTCDDGGGAGTGVHCLDGTIVRNNRVHLNGTHGGVTFGILVSYGTDIRVYNNLVYDNDDGGILVYTNSVNALVANNTVYSNDGSQDNAGIQIQFTSGTPTAVINNISYLNIFDDIVDYDMDATLTTNLTTDPDFVAAGVGNLHVNAGSDAINAGTTVSIVTVDHDGIARAQGAAYDIGAYEFVE